MSQKIMSDHEHKSACDVGASEEAAPTSCMHVVNQQHEALSAFSKERRHFDAVHCRRAVNWKVLAPLLRFLFDTCLTNELFSTEPWPHFKVESNLTDMSGIRSFF